MTSVVRRTRITAAASGSLMVYAPAWKSGTVVAYALNDDDAKGRAYYAQLQACQDTAGTQVKAALFPVLPPGNYGVSEPGYTYVARKTTIFPGLESEVDLR